MIAALPAPMRRELRFASWTAKDTNAYGIAAVGVPGGDCERWSRLLMAEVAPVVPQTVEAYARKVGGLVSAGDLPGLCRFGRDQTTTPAARPLACSAPVLGEGAGKGAPAPAKRPPVHPDDADHAALAPAAKRTRDHPHDAWTAVSPIRAAARPRLGRADRIVAAPGRNVRGARRTAVFALAALLLVAGIWARLPQISAFFSQCAKELRMHRHGATSVATLLRVVDVGGVYDRVLSTSTRAGMRVTGEGGSDRRKVQLDFQNEAAGPLLQQVDLFVDLAAEGIQHADRPDREIERLESLAGQGGILELEMRRLELAW